MITLQLLLPLSAAMLYAIAALFLNAAGRAGVSGFLLVLGQGFTVLALSLGEVSIVAPIMGLNGFEGFIPPAMLLGAAFSLLFILPGSGGIRTLSRPAGKVLIPGGMLLALQSLLLIFAIILAIDHPS